MRLAMITLVLAVLLAGCASTAPRSASGDAAPVSPEASAVATAPAGIGPNNPRVPLEDARGRTPESAVFELMDALAKRDWAAAYALYAEPTPNAEMAAKEWSENPETYSDFTVLETRVADEEHAWVRVTYDVTVTPAGASPYAASVQAPGEWWRIEKVDGEWKVGWLPRQ